MVEHCKFENHGSLNINRKYIKYYMKDILKFKEIKEGVVNVDVDSSLSGEVDLDDSNKESGEDNSIFNSDGLEDNHRESIIDLIIPIVQNLEWKAGENTE
jgi:hypothetical protein